MSIGTFVFYPSKHWKINPQSFSPQPQATHLKAGAERWFVVVCLGGGHEDRR
jgi:hypothetical protein